MTTSQKNILVRLNRLVDKVNPNIDVEQWKKPFKSQDLFQEKYLKRMFKIAVLFVALALGLVTRNDPSIITNLAFLVHILFLNYFQNISCIFISVWGLELLAVFFRKLRPLLRYLL